MPTNINFNSSLGVKRGSNITLASNPVTPLLLDTYPNAAVAYSLRKLRTAYTGSAIRVRRLNDNAEQNIGFIGNDLDTNSMLDFVGYNLWTYSEEVNNVAYIKGGLNTTGTPPYIDQATAPDGTLTGDKLIESTANGQHVLSRSTVVLLNGVSYNFSVFVKQAERTKIYVGTNISGSSVFCDIDLTNGTILNNGLSNTPIITAEANGWYRVSFNLIGLGSSAGVSVGLLNASNQRLYVGNNTSGAFVWGFQISQSSTVKPYQKTVAFPGAAGFIGTWYDQSGNGNNAVQNTANAQQAQIVSNGYLILDPNTNKISTLWSGDAYILGTNLTTPQLNYQLAVFNRPTASIANISLGNTVTSAFLGNWRADNTLATFYGNLVITHLTSTATGAFIQTVLRNSANNVKCWNNNVALTGGTDSRTTQVFTRWGQYTTPQSSGYKQELIYWTSDQEANRTGIETNANNYWNVY
jgi:hypothetical protein